MDPLVTRFDLEIRDKKTANNLLIDHLSHLNAPNIEHPITNPFPMSNY